MEHPLCFEFAWSANRLIKSKGDDNFFNLVFFVASGVKVICPKVSCSTYIENGNRMPMLAFKRDYLVSLKDANHIPLTKEVIGEFGKIYQNDFDYEYAGFESF